MNSREWIKKYLKYIIIAIVVFGFLIPFLIHIVFKISAPVSFFSAQWSAGEFLTFYSSLLAFFSTTYLGIIAYYQNREITRLSEQSNCVNEKMAKAQLIGYKSYVKIDITKIAMNANEISDILKISFIPLNDIPIVSLKGEACYEVKRNTGWEKVGQDIERQVDEIGVLYITKPDIIILDNSFDSVEEQMEILVSNFHEDYYLKIFCFTLVIKNIYGYETKQLFNIVTANNAVVSYNTIEKI